MFSLFHFSLFHFFLFHGRPEPDEPEVFNLYKMAATVKRVKPVMKVIDPDSASEGGDDRGEGEDPWGFKEEEEMGQAEGEVGEIEDVGIEGVEGKKDKG